MATKAEAGSDQMRRKGAVIDEIRSKLDAADAAVLTEYRGLTVTELATLRASLRPADTEYKVFKNTLARRAAQDTGLAEIIPLLEGPVAIAFVSGDAVVAAKALRDFARINPKLVVKGGLLRDRVLGPDEMEALADIAPRDVLLARLAGGFQAPLVKAAGLFQAFTRNMAYGLKALLDQRIAAGEGLPEPELGDPQASQPETMGTQASQPETVETQASEPETVETQASEPETVETQASEPETVETQASEPETVETQASVPDAAEPEAAEPEAAAPEPAGTGAGDAEASEPAAAETQSQPDA
jgi:large subunit ribosomal protein L10